MGPGRAVRTAWRFLVDVVNEVRRDQLLDVAAGVTFWLLLSLPAALLAAVGSATYVGANTARAVEDAVISIVETTFASESDAIRRNIEGLFVERSGLLGVSLAIAIFTLSRGFAGLLRALDTAYNVIERRSFIGIRLVAIGLAIGTLLTTVGSVTVWLWMRSLGAPPWVGSLLALGLLIIWAATVYHLGPHHHTPWRYDLPGALFAAIGWLVMSIGFGWYVQIAGTGNQIVGTLGGVLLGFTWLWLVSVVLLLGAEINGVVARRRDVVRAPGVITGRLVQVGRTTSRHVRSRRHTPTGDDLDHEPGEFTDDDIDDQREERPA